MPISVILSLLEKLAPTILKYLDSHPAVLESLAQELITAIVNALKQHNGTN